MSCSNLKHNTPFLAVIADDLTGALDTGIQFANAGARTMTITKADPHSLSEYLDEGYEVISIDASTRHLDGEAAARIVSSVVQQCRAAGVRYLYKKTDSVLRGNISEEIRAFMEADGVSVLPYVPAFPDLGRTVEHGVLYVNGKPLLSTELGCDPFDRVRSSKVSDLFTQSDVSVRDSVDAGYLPPSEEGDGIVIYDAKDNGDLDRIAAGLLSSGFSAFAGCAGFADALSRVFPFPKKQESSVKVGLPMLIICGSVNEVSKRQIQHEEDCGTKRIRLNESMLSDPSFFDSDKGQEIIGSIASGLSMNGAVIVDTEGEREGASLSETNLENAVSSSLGELAVRLLASVDGLGLFIIGGDTMLSFLDKAGSSEIEPIEEIEKGIVLSVLHKDGRAVPVISKSGGFGGEDILTKILDKYRKQEVSI